LEVLIAGVTAVGLITDWSAMAGMIVGKEDQDENFFEKGYIAQLSHLRSLNVPFLDFLTSCAFIHVHATVPKAYHALIKKKKGLPGLKGYTKIVSKNKIKQW
jgi:hypothetical protein